eukprot:TRINITY_DN6566_c3_g1_i1.p1 TRINITY_DN6566_c3_g1~~TRINITY_DN6566_c3_g1_i1.p1  ORF type:complete len:339 (+),score=45.07 TRINITY_DN6566_c3_g1_i1:110-1126(+)
MGTDGTDVGFGNQVIGSMKTPSNATGHGLRKQRHGGVLNSELPFRLDIDIEYQDWILVAVSFLAVILWCLPCLCGRMKNRCSRQFISVVSKRLHNFFCIITYFNVAILLFTIGACPGWSVNDYVEHSVKFICWVLEHLAELVQSIVILCCFYVLVQFRDRIAVAAGIQHLTPFRFGWKDLIPFQANTRPVEIFIWKVDNLLSSSGKLLKGNDIFVECHYGYNEPMRTRVHNNAGSGCAIKESIQLNIEGPDAEFQLFFRIKDQSLIASTELAKLVISTKEMYAIEDQTGKRRSEFDYSERNFVKLALVPAGEIWLAIAPVVEGDEEMRPLMDDALVTC